LSQANLTQAFRRDQMAWNIWKRVAVVVEIELTLGHQ
jgi:hypothetical protein